MKRNAFTLMELLVGIMILAITSAVVIVNVNALKGQTAKREAERLAHWLTNQMSIADSRNERFELYVDDGQLEDKKVFVWWGIARTDEKDKDYFKVSKGCNFRLNDKPDGQRKYQPETNNFAKGGTIKVIGKEGSAAPYYVIIDTIGGRIRVDDKPPKS